VISGFGETGLHFSDSLGYPWYADDRSWLGLPAPDRRLEAAATEVADPVVSVGGNTRHGGMASDVAPAAES